MVYNGIEYFDMQFIGEVYQLMCDGLGLIVLVIVDVFIEWNNGDLDSYLVEIIVEVLWQIDVKIGKLFVDVIVDWVEQKGIGCWIVKFVLDLGVLVIGIVEVVFVCVFLGFVG